MFHLLRNSYTSSKPKISRFSLKRPKHLLPISLTTFSHLSPPEIKHFQIKELYYESHILFIFTNDSLIYFYNLLSNKLIHLSLFSTPTTKAKSITLNKCKQSLLITYIELISNQQELKCCEIPFHIIKHKISTEEPFTKDDFVFLFKRETFISPAFIEFDEINKIILTKNSLGTFKIWAMHNYTMNFEITDKRIEEVRLADDVLITIKTTNVLEKLLLSVYDILNGKILYNYEIKLISNSMLIFLEIFRHVLFMKQECHVPIFINLITLETHFLTEDFDVDTFFLFVNTKRIVIAVDKNIIYFYNLQGEMIKKIYHDNCSEPIRPNDLCISVDKRLMCICYKGKKIFSNQSSQSVFRGNNICSRSNTSSKRSFINIINEDVFDCSLSAISKKHVQDDNELNTIREEDSYKEITSCNYIDIIELDDIRKGVAKRITFNYNAEFSNIIIDDMNCAIYGVTVFGSIYEINI
jgi:hypothetical protein